MVAQIRLLQKVTQRTHDDSSKKVITEGNSVQQALVREMFMTVVQFTFPYCDV